MQLNSKYFTLCSKIILTVFNEIEIKYYDLS